MRLDLNLLRLKNKRRVLTEQLRIIGIEYSIGFVEEDIEKLFECEQFWIESVLNVN